MMGRVNGQDGRSIEDQARTVSAANDLALEGGCALDRLGVRQDMFARFIEAAGCYALLEAAKGMASDVDHAAT
jgi:hypothetical protein